MKRAVRTLVLVVAVCMSFAMASPINTGTNLMPGQFCTPGHCN